MLDFLAGVDITITVPFTRDGEPFVPDPTGLQWTLRGQNGAVLATSGLSGVTDTQVHIPVLATYNNLTGPSRFEKRAVVVRGTVGGQAFTSMVFYRLAPWLNMTASREAVRTFIGCDVSELGDHEISLIEAYVRVADKVGGDATLNAALSSGTSAEITANRGIVAQAVLLALPGVRQRMAKKESDGTRDIERFAIDFDRLQADAQADLDDAIAVVGAVDDTTAIPVIFMLTTPTDPVTGV
jgi:hypothetical protein